jgi:hypothetical protein
MAASAVGLARNTHHKAGRGVETIDLTANAKTIE